MPKAEPQLLLICCEGRTEERYFSILKEVFRINGAVDIQIVSGDGRQHRNLVDLATEKRQEILVETGIFELEDDIETWVVCDRDSYADSFIKLRTYGEEHDIHVAFSDPQFENYILQHFGSPNNTRNKGSILEKELTEVMLEADISAAYTKGDLEWLRDMIDSKFSIVPAAIRHADTFSNHTKRPFFTVQRLVERLIDFSEVDE